MPIYEYKCNACGHRMEKLQRLSDDPLKDCPACGQPELSKLVSAAGFKLKGTGWYETDFKNNGKKSVSDASKADSSSKDSASSQGSGSSKTNNSAAKTDTSSKKAAD
jgi:putative FmdB family regulatory protein